MSPIGPLTTPTPTGTRRQRVTLQTPATVPTADGGYTETWTDLDPAVVHVRLQPASVGDLERITAGTVVASATHVARMPYHPGVTIQTRLVYGARTFSVVGITNPEERNRELILTCTEVIA